MKRFAPYVRELEALVLKAVDESYSKRFDRKSVEAALDGEPSAKIREAIPVEILRHNNAFFISPELRF